jgi:acetyl esterase/lipase
MPEVFGEGYTAADIDRAAGDLNIRENTPPAFIWGTFEDVLFQQWPPYVKALKKRNIPYSYHIFPKGPHGLGLAPGHPEVSQWPLLCAEWLIALGFMG